MNCRSAESLFSALIEDELSQKERRDFEAHLLGCRRCSAGVRELRATLALVRSVPAIETSPHFEEDVYARIRSGEALRPSVLEWVNGLLAPIRLRPLVAAGAGLCAIAFAVVMVFHPTVPGSTSPAPTASVTPSPVSSIQPAPTASIQSPRLPGPGASGRSATELAGVTDGAHQPAATDSAGSLARPEAGYQDEYIMDQFLLERAPAGRDPSMVPVSGSQGDDVYITF
jgi:hypothetical protein